MYRLAIILLALLCAPGLFAYEELVGEECPDWSADVCVNAPENTRNHRDACLGNVVLLKYWGPN